MALRLSRPETAIVVDNAVRSGATVGPANAGRDVVGVRRMFDMMAREPRLQATAVQTVGAKGWDGFALAIVESRTRFQASCASTSAAIRLSASV